MAYEISGYVDATNAPSDAETVFNNWLSSHNTVTDSSRYRKVAKRDDGTLQAYHEFTAYLSFDENVDAALDDLINSRFSTVEWFVVHRSHSSIEESEYVNDETYFSSSMDTGLRANPSFTIDSPQVRSHGAIHYRINGTNYTVPSGSVDFSDVNLSNGVKLYATDTEELVIDGSGVLVGEVSDNATIDGENAPHITTEGFSIPETDDSIHFVRGTPPTYFENPTESFPESINPEYFARNYVSEESLSAIETQIDNLKTDNPDVADALDNIAHIITGDDRFE